MNTYDKLLVTIDKADTALQTLTYYVDNIMGDGFVPIEMMQVHDILKERAAESLVELITITMQYNREANEQETTTPGS